MEANTQFYSFTNRLISNRSTRLRLTNRLGEDILGFNVANAFRAERAETNKFGHGRHKSR